MPDSLPPSRILRIVDAHDAAMRVERPRMTLTNAIYLTRFWKAWLGYLKSEMSITQVFNGFEIEVNRLKEEVSTYTAALWPRANRVVCSDDPQGRGSAQAASLTLNAWWAQPGLREDIRGSVILGILFPGCGYKVGYDAGRADPIERAWLRIIPPWEIVLDRNATNRRDERYRGHVYFEPIETFLARFPDLKGKNIKGSRRQDFFDDTGNGNPGNPVANNPNNSEYAQSTGTDADGEFVRVLEIANFADSVTGKSGNTYKGRLEVWVLDQTDEFARAPVSMEPLPFADTDGKPLPHIELLSFDHEPGFPFRPVAPANRFLPQLVELNKMRTLMAEMTRRDSRKGLVAEGRLEQDQMTILMNGRDMEFAKVKLEDGQTLRDVIYQLETPRISADIPAWMQIIEHDFQAIAGTSPNARGEVTKATAYEIQQVQLFTESELGEHGLILNETLTRVATLILRAIIGAMRDRGDSAGSEDVPDAPLAPVGKGHDVELDTEEQAAGAVAAGIQGEPGPTTSPEASPGGVAPADGGTVRTGTTVELESQTFALKGENGEKVVVTIEALDGAFPVTYTDGGRTPLTAQATLEFMTGPGLQQYMALWDLVQKGGPAAILAERAMAHTAEQADLPKDMHPAEMIAAWKAKQAEEEASRPKKAPDAAPPPPSGGESEMIQALTVIAQALQSVGPSPILDAVSHALDGARAGDGDAVRAGVTQAAQLLAQIGPVPPEAQQAIDVAKKGIGAIAQAIGSASSAPAPEEERAPVAPPSGSAEMYA